MIQVRWLRRAIGTFYLLAQKLVFHNSDLNKSTTICKVGDLEVFPKAYIHVHKVHVYEVYAHEVHAYEVHAHEVYAREMHAHEVHACEVHAHKMHTLEVHACEMHV